MESSFLRDGGREAGHFNGEHEASEREVSLARVRIEASSIKAFGAIRNALDHEYHHKEEFPFFYVDVKKMMIYITEKLSKELSIWEELKEEGSQILFREWDEPKITSDPRAVLSDGEVIMVVTLGDQEVSFSPKKGMDLQELLRAFNRCSRTALRAPKQNIREVEFQGDS